MFLLHNRFDAYHYFAEMDFPILYDFDYDGRQLF